MHAPWLPKKSEDYAPQKRMDRGLLPTYKPITGVTLSAAAPLKSGPSPDFENKMTLGQSLQAFALRWHFGRIEVDMHTPVSYDFNKSFRPRPSQNNQVHDPS
jgi:hypothetical protein